MDIDEKLIEEVRKMPIIYNLGLEDYKNTKKKELAWRQVSSAMQSEGKCKKRWKGLRDSYKRIKRSQLLASGSGAPSPKRKWRYMEAMSFLDKAQASRSTIGNESDTESESTSIISPSSKDSTPPPHKNDSPRPSARARKETQQKFNDFLKLASQSIKNTCSAFCTQEKELDSTFLHFQTLASKIKESGIPKNVANEIEAKVSALVFYEIENHLNNM
ncbi:uncharacterized protein [Eurosta solidaginis]|uniref:uncharacterized protein n=1 Tax=Eurosta solidaginis TaxID=178769 RepID=UPI0035314142